MPRVWLVLGVVIVLLSGTVNARPEITKPPRAFIIYDRVVRVSVAADGTQTKRIVLHGGSRGANGSGMRVTSIFIDYDADPYVFRDKTVNLHLRLKQVRSNQPAAFPVVYHEAVQATQKMPRNKPMVVAAVAETADPVVRKAVKAGNPLPVTGEPYSVLYIYFQAYTGPK